MVFCVEGSAMAKFCVAERFDFFVFKKRSSIYPGIARQLARLVKKQEIDILHLHDAHAHTFACMAASVFGMSKPLVLSRRVDFPIKKNVFSRWKYNHPAIKAIICVSHFIKGVLEKDIRQSGKIKVVHSGIDTSRFSFSKNTKLRNEFEIPDTGPLIANVAAIASHKDYYTFVDTALLIVSSKPDARFLIIGADGGEQKAIEAYIQKAGLQKHIHLTGFRTDIPEILQGIDLFLFTSKEEGLGTSLLDALASKVPIVATNAGGIPEIVLHEKTGLTANIGDAKSLANAVLRLLDDKAFAKKLSQIGLEHLKSFSKANTAEKTLAIYNQILKGA